MDIKEELKKLIELQKIDSQVYNLQQNKDVNLPLELKELATKIEDKKTALKEAEATLQKAQLKKKDCELTLAQKEEGITKSQTQLYQLKTNKEYQAKLSEIASLKADKSLLEEEVLKSLEDIEKAQKLLNEAKEAFTKEETELKQQQMQISDRLKKAEDGINILNDKRRILTDGVHPEILSKYERLLQTRSGLAIAGIANQNCGACFMRLTAQNLNEIKMYKDLVCCEACLRILYIPEDLSL